VTWLAGGLSSSCEDQKDRGGRGYVFSHPLPVCIYSEKKKATRDGSKKLTIALYDLLCFAMRCAVYKMNFSKTKVKSRCFHGIPHDAFHDSKNMQVAAMSALLLLFRIPWQRCCIKAQLSAVYLLPSPYLSHFCSKIVKA
jgi:hypothetical protein